jgi:hypothetical protein
VKLLRQPLEVTSKRRPAQKVGGLLGRDIAWLEPRSGLDEGGRAQARLGLLRAGKAPRALEIREARIEGRLGGDAVHGGQEAPDVSLPAASGDEHAPGRSAACMRANRRS